jgi:hypothetical protein
MDQQRVAFKQRHGTNGDVPPPAHQSIAAPAASPLRRLLRRAARRVAALLALLILFYATSLHGVSLRTLILVGILILCLYWIFKNHLSE